MSPLDFLQAFYAAGAFLLDSNGMRQLHKKLVKNLEDESRPNDVSMFTTMVFLPL